MERLPIQPHVCAHAVERISLRLDAELSDFGVVQLESHLERCPACRAFAEAAADTTRMLRGAPLEEFSFSFKLPRSRPIYGYGLRVASTTAAAVIVGLGSVVGLDLVATNPGSAYVGVDRSVIGLKDRQLSALEARGRQQAVRRVAQGVTAAETTDGRRPGISPAIGRLTTVGSRDSIGGKGE